MFAKKHAIIYFSRSKIQAALVVLKSNPSLEKGIQTKWTQKTLIKILEQIKAKLGAKTVRVLLSDELSYVLTLEIPADIADVRSAIAKEIAQRVPEILDSQQWDYKLLAKKADVQQKTKKVLVFAPVKEYSIIFTKAAKKVGLEIEAMEPVSLAKKRHKHPFVGLALKEDLKGKDPEVLNLEEQAFSQASVVSEEKAITGSFDQLIKKDDAKEKDKNVKKTSGKRLVFLLMMMLVMLVLLVVVLLQRQTKKQQAELSSSTDTELAVVAEERAMADQQAQELSEQLEPTATPDPNNLANYSILILNGSGIAGEATRAEEALEDAGVETITTDNTSTFDHSNIDLKRKNIVPDTIVEQLTDALETEFTELTVLEQDYLQDDLNYDVLIVVGQKP